MDDIRISAAGEHELDVIVGLWHELMAYHERLDPTFELRADAEVPFRDFLLRHIRRPDGMVWLAWDGYEAVGYAMARIEKVPPVFITDETCLLQDLMVAPHARRKGVGRALTEKVVRWAKVMGQEQVQLQVASANPDGIAFWHAMGFDDHLIMMRRPLP